MIEVNSNPCLEESSLLLKKLLPRMIGKIILIIINNNNNNIPIIDDAFKLTLDVLFPPIHSHFLDGRTPYDNFPEKMN